MTNISLVPVAATPKDFNAILEKLKANQKEGAFHSFEVKDELTMSAKERESYHNVMTELSQTRLDAASYKPVDNTKAYGLTDRNPEKNQVSVVDGYQRVIEVSFDDKEEPTRFSLIGKTKSTLFQESDGVVIFANFDEEKGDSGILFDKTAHTGVVWNC